MGYSLFVTGLTHCDERRTFPGLTLFTTMSGDAVTLIDLGGNEVRRWTPPPGMKAFYARGTDDGTLLAHFVDGTEQGGPAGGRAATLMELDWDGNVVWQYHNPTLHHDHYRRRDGSTLLVSAELLDKETSRAVARGDTGLDTGEILSEALIEVARDGSITWQWHAHEHLDPTEYAFRPESGEQWLHCNAVYEVPGGNVMASFNTLSVVVIVDKATGKIVWRLKEGTTGSQHNPTVLQNGNILLFDNGSRRNYSRVIELDPATQEVVWEFVGNPRDSFYSQNISGAQRLPNGNTLICEGRSARFFEVTAEKEIVWEYISPYQTMHMGQRSRAVFRAHRYASDSGFIRGRA